MTENETPIIELKSEQNRVLDDVSRSGNSLLEYLRTLDDLDFEDDGLVAAIRTSGAGIRDTLERLVRARQAEGELPSVGSGEGAQLAALAAKARSLLSSDPEAHSVVCSVRDHAAEVATHLAEARELGGHAAPVNEALQALGAELDALTSRFDIDK